MKVIETPWGPAECVTDIGGGILHIETQSHGGYFVPRELNVLVPLQWRTKSFNARGMVGWYEEECDWCLVALTFPQQFPAHAREEARRAFKWFAERTHVAA